MAAQEFFTTPLFNDPNLVAYYRAENVNDSKASFNLTNNNSVAFNAAKFNNGFDFGATNTTKYLSIANNLGISGNFSINLWINITTAPSGSDSWIFSLENATTHVRFVLTYRDTGGTKTLVLDRVKGGVGTQTATLTAGLGTGVFHMLTAVYDGATITVYLDSTGFNQVAASGNGSSGLSDFFGIATVNTGSNVNLSGIVDDVSIFNRALTSSEINSLFNGFPGGMIGKFRS